MIISDEDKKKLDKTAQAKVNSGDWAISNNSTGQVAIYPTSYGGGGVSKPSTPSDDIAELAYKMKQQKQLEIERAKKATLSNLSAEKTATEGQFRTAMNDTATQADIALKNYYESVANRGQTNSGSTAQGELSQNVAKQNAMSGLQTARTSALSDIDRRRSLAEQGYLDDMNSANNLIDISTYQNLIDLKREQERNAITQEQNLFERGLAQDKMALDIGDYNRLRNSNYDTSSLEQQRADELAQIENDNKLKRVQVMLEAGDWAGLEREGYNAAALKKQWDANLAKTNRTNTGGSPESNSNVPTIYLKALEMKNKSFYPPQDIVNYILMQGLPENEEFKLIDDLGYFEEYKKMYGGETTQNSTNEQVKKLINRFLP